MTKLELIQIGDDSVGLILPEQILARLHVENGDTVFLSETETGFVLKTSAPADVAPSEKGETP